MNPQERFKQRQQTREQVRQPTQQNINQNEKKTVSVAQAKQGKLAIKKLKKTDKGIVISFTKV